MDPTQPLTKMTPRTELEAMQARVAAMLKDGCSPADHMLRCTKEEAAVMDKVRTDMPKLLRVVEAAKGYLVHPSLDGTAARHAARDVLRAALAELDKPEED